MKCPICKKEFEGYPATLRINSKTKICSICSGKEAGYDYNHREEIATKGFDLNAYNEKKLKFLKGE